MNLPINLFVIFYLMIVDFLLNTDFHLVLDEYEFVGLDLKK